MSSKKYYVVWKGRKTGIFTSWQECEEQINGFSNARYKLFKTLEEAELALKSAENSLTVTSEHKEVKQQNIKIKTIPEEKLIIDSICVDASCISNGNVEYRGVDTATKNVIFHKNPMSKGTNNLGEFLAIVHALAYLKKQGRNIPVYSDSQTAIIWIKKKQVGTKLKRNGDNEEIFNLKERASKWLEDNEYTNTILKWNTQAWGENPADFGRK